MITESFVTKSSVFMALRNSLCPLSVPLLAAQRSYSSQNQIEHCFYTILGLTSLSCDDRKVNSINQLILAWTIMGSNLRLIILSYTFILKSVLKLNRSCTQGLKYLHFTPHPNHFLLHYHHCHFQHTQCRNKNSMYSSPSQCAAQCYFPCPQPCAICIQE
jgi:hypothetical protein